MRSCYDRPSNGHLAYVVAAIKAKPSTPAAMTDAPLQATDPQPRARLVLELTFTR